MLVLSAMIWSWLDNILTALLLFRLKGSLQTTFLTETAQCGDTNRCTDRPHEPYFAYFVAICKLVVTHRNITLCRVWSLVTLLLSANQSSGTISWWQRWLCACLKIGRYCSTNAYHAHFKSNPEKPWRIHEALHMFTYSLWVKLLKFSKELVEISGMDRSSCQTNKRKVQKVFSPLWQECELYWKEENNWEIIFFKFSLNWSR